MSQKNRQSLLFLFVLLCFANLAYQLHQNRSLPQPVLNINNGQLATVNFQNLEVVSFNPPPPNMGGLDIWLDEGQVAEIEFNFEKAGQVVVTTDPLFKKGLSLGFLEVQTLKYTTSGAVAGSQYLHSRQEPGVERMYVAANGQGRTHFWVRFDNSLPFQQIQP